MSKPLIGINADYRPAKHDAPAFSFLAAGYYDSVLQAGGLPVVLPPYSEAADIEQILETLDGLVLVGGADLDPRRDGWMLHPTVVLQDPRRESFDRRLVRLAGERRLPIFGIGAALAIAWSPLMRLLIALPAHVLRTLPVLARPLQRPPFIRPALPLNARLRSPLAMKIT